MRLIAFVFNLPWTFIGLFGAILSVPAKVALASKPLAIVFTVKSFWWYRWLPGKQHVRAITNGNVVQLGPRVLEKDLEHELIHVEQSQRLPFMYPFLYAWQSYKHGYRQNKYEDEAYARSGSKYV